jgi:hypothetical protein
MGLQFANIDIGTITIGGITFDLEARFYPVQFLPIAIFQYCQIA